MSDEMNDFLYRLRNVDKKMDTSREQIEALTIKIEFTFLMLANNMAYLDSEEWL
jgi:hypothetical protein